MSLFNIKKEVSLSSINWGMKSISINWFSLNLYFLSFISNEKINIFFFSFSTIVANEKMFESLENKLIIFDIENFYKGL